MGLIAELRVRNASVSRSGCCAFAFRESWTHFCMSSATWVAAAPADTRQRDVSVVLWASLEGELRSRTEEQRIIVPDGSTAPPCTSS